MMEVNILYLLIWYKLSLHKDNTSFPEQGIHNSNTYLAQESEAFLCGTRQVQW